MTRGLHLKYFELSLDTVRQVASGQDLGDAARYLRGTEFSRRMLLIRQIISAVEVRPELLGPLAQDGFGWPVLATAQEARGPQVRELIERPLVGLWATHVVRLLAGAAQDDAPLWTHLAYLPRLAAAAALLAGIDAHVVLPVQSGCLQLPGVGSARVGGDASNLGETVGVEIRSGQAWVRRSTGPEQLSFDSASQPTVRVTASGADLTVSLEASEPYPRLFGLAPSSRPEDRLPESWRPVLGDAWALIVREHPGQVSGLSIGLQAIIPLALSDPTSPASGSAADGFGAAAVTRSVDHVELAVALIHEFQHSMLNGLLHLKPMLEADTGLYYAPWRDDPRSLGSLLHGAYAFSSVTRFWRDRRAFVRNGSAERAAFEFALWRARTAVVLPSLEASSRLTEAGRHFVDVLRAQVDGWLQELVLDPVATSARQAVLAHQSAWRAHHLRVDPGWLRVAADCWRNDATPPSLDLPPGRGALVTVRPDPEVGFLDQLAVAYRRRLANGPATDDDRSADAEIALTTGDITRARDLYLAQIQDGDRRPAAWGGLGLALQSLGRPAASSAARILVERPEVVRAVHAAVNRPPVGDIATWLASAVDEPAS